MAKPSVEDRALPQAKQDFGLWFRNSCVSSFGTADGLVAALLLLTATPIFSLFLGRWFIRCLCWDLDLKVIDEYALQRSTVYIYSPGNMPDVQLTVVLLIQKPLLIEL